MFDRAAVALIALAIVCAAAVLAVFASGFALFAFVAPSAGAAGAAGLVALIAALFVGACALFATSRAEQRAREAEAAKTQLMNDLPLGLGRAASERPLAAIAISLLGGLLAARHPQLARELAAIIARLAPK